MILTTTWPSLGCTRLWPRKEPSLCRCHLKCFPWSSHRPHCEPSHCVFQRKDFPSNSFYVVVVVKTEDEACGGPLRYYPLRPDELFDAGNRTKVLDIVVSPAINCKSWFRPPRGPVCVCGLVQRHLLSLRSRGVCDGNAVLSGDLPFFLPAHFAGGLCGEQAVRHLHFLVVFFGFVIGEAAGGKLGAWMDKTVSKIGQKVLFLLFSLIFFHSQVVCLMLYSTFLTDMSLL